MIYALCLATALAFGKIGRQEKNEHFIKMLSDPDPALRTSAVQALRKLGNSKAIEHLYRVLNDNKPSVRALAIQAICVLGGKQAPDQHVEIMIKMLKDPSDHVRRAAYQALSKIVRSLDMRKLQEVLLDRDHSVRALVVRTLGEFDNELEADQHVEIMIRMLDDPEDDVQLAARNALSRFCRDKFALRACRESDLLVYLFEHRYGLRSIIVQTLVDLDSIEGLLEHESANVRKDAKKEHEMLKKNRDSIPRAGKIKTKQNQTGYKDKEIAIIEELVDMINKGKIRSLDALEEQKRKMCENKECLPPPSSHAIRMKLGRVEEYELFGGIWCGVAAEARRRPDPKRPLFKGSSSTGYRRARS